MLWQVLAGRRPRSEQSLPPLPIAGRMWEATGKILQIFYFKRTNIFKGLDECSL